VDDAGVVAGLVGGDVVFFLDDKQALAGETARKFQASCESNNARTDNEEVCLVVGHE
jgi:hypothetical protein